MTSEDVDDDKSRWLEYLSGVRFIPQQSFISIGVYLITLCWAAGMEWDGLEWICWQVGENTPC